MERAPIEQSLPCSMFQKAQDRLVTEEKERDHRHPQQGQRIIWARPPRTYAAEVLGSRQTPLARSASRSPLPHGTRHHSAAYSSTLSLSICLSRPSTPDPSPTPPFPSDYLPPTTGDGQKPHPSMAFGGIPSPPRRLLSAERHRSLSPPSDPPTLLPTPTSESVGGFGLLTEPRWSFHGRCAQRPRAWRTWR